MSEISKPKVSRVGVLWYVGVWLTRFYDKLIKKSASIQSYWLNQIEKCGQKQLELSRVQSTDVKREFDEKSSFGRWNFLDNVDERFVMCRVCEIFPLRPFHRLCESCSRTQLRHISCAVSRLLFTFILRHRHMTFLFSPFMLSLSFLAHRNEAFSSSLASSYDFLTWKGTSTIAFCTHFSKHLSSGYCDMWYVVVKFGVLGLAKGKKS